MQPSATSNDATLLLLHLHCISDIPQALGSVDRYSASAAKDVIKATAWLVEAAQGEVLPYRDQLGEILLPGGQNSGRVADRGFGRGDEGFVKSSNAFVLLVCGTSTSFEFVYSAVMSPAGECCLE